MIKEKKCWFKKGGRAAFVLFTAGVLSACGQKQMAAVELLESRNEQESLILEINTDNMVEASQTEDKRQKFGEHCIADQTFEVELSEYKGKVYFVPFAPSKDNSDFYMQIIQDGKVLANIQAYVPSQLAGKKFSSLDAVAFYDVNYDNNTDIVLIETYENTSFAAIYYGFASDAEDYEPYFMPQEQLSEQLSSQLNPLTVPQIREFLSGGKKNGQFTSYQEAYRAVSRLCELESTGEKKYDLIYFDQDDIPELVAGVNGYYVSLYTYHDGKVYTAMDRWAYGAMGNAGYEYLPGENRLRNYNSDYAGAIYYTTFMALNHHYSMENTVEIKTYNFDDVNKNGIPDEEEMGSMGYYQISYIQGVEATDEECASYNVGEYQNMVGKMSAKELQSKLN